VTEYVDRRTRLINAPPKDVFAVVCRLGGDAGWFSPRWLWRLRGWLDRLGGGPGLTPRRDAVTLEIGDTVDFWRVTALEPPERLRMLSEMKMPGVGILEFEMTPGDPSARSCRLCQKATFAPAGPLGHLYWFSLSPVHLWIFRRMINGIARTAEMERGALGARTNG
jgi:hypothetical protein